jgi:hypothetical protein
MMGLLAAVCWLAEFEFGSSLEIARLLLTNGKYAIFDKHILRS